MSCENKDAKTKRLTVFYDGACPICDREIGFYRRRTGADRIHWQDLAGNSVATLPEGLSRETALKRFHVMDETGRLYAGAYAFIKLWQTLPSFHTAACILGFRPLARMLDKAYDLFLAVRPFAQAITRTVSGRRRKT